MSLEQTIDGFESILKGEGEGLDEVNYLDHFRRARPYS